MSWKTMAEQGEKTYQKFLKKLLKSPQTVEVLRGKTGLSAGSVRKLALRAVGESKAVQSKKGNAVMYAKATVPKISADMLRAEVAA